MKVLKTGKAEVDFLFMETGEAEVVFVFMVVMEAGEGKVEDAFHFMEVKEVTEAGLSMASPASMACPPLLCHTLFS